ncbi:uncharacterized protein LOC114728262 [Neltuma alba]|uniref:uncharacterized protein LOC114728262 n=1 Tax=Neltuma alba TaxID=207710 RepID=UPI0010A35050|nr:uncharacterized protein LOC114728262 [Prosopis alba]
MTSYESLTFYCSSQEEDFDDADMDDGDDQNELPNPQNLSKLSVCSSSASCGAEDSDLTMYFSNLSIESFEGEGDADEEFAGGNELPGGLSSDSEIELGGCYSLPAKYYASDNERRKKSGEKMRKIKKKEKKEEQANQGMSGESDESGGGRGLMVITRPKGGRRSLCMDMGEVKACKELGFELEHERMLQVPSRLSLSSSSLDNSTGSGGNSPISNWRVSSPGDDPRDVKARLRLWAQAVAMASASKHGN